ncbi:hypothetical protein GIB67_010814, partial [Kingdonia uniflora]
MFAEPVLTCWPLSKLRDKALKITMKHIHYNDENSRYFTLGCVEKVLRMLACWVEDPKSDAFKKHLARVPDYLWMAEDGMRVQSLSSQMWNTGFGVQALLASNFQEEITHTLKKGYDLIKQSQLVSNPPGSDAFRVFCKVKAAAGGKWGKCVEFAGRTLNDNIIWVKGNCIQRDDEEPLDLRFRSVKQSKCEVQSGKERILVGRSAEEETELELILEELGLSRKKRVNSRSNKARMAQSTNLAQPNPVKLRKVAQLFPKKRMLKTLPASGTTGSGEVVKEKRRRVKPSGESGEKVVEGRSALVDDLKEVEERVVRLVKGMWLGIEEERSKLKKVKSELEKDLARTKTEAIKEVRQMKAPHVVVIGQLQVEAKANLEEMVEECDRLGRYLMLKGYSEEEVDAIKADTYIEVEDEEGAGMVGIVDDLDGISKQTVLDNQGDDVELLMGGSEKVKLDLSRAREDNVLMCDQEFAEQFDRMKEANVNKDDQYVKTHFRPEKFNQAVPDLTLQVEEKDSEIKKGLEELSEATERAEKLQHQVDVLAVK